MLNVQSVATLGAAQVVSAMVLEILVVEDVKVVVVIKPSL